MRKTRLLAALAFLVAAATPVHAANLPSIFLLSAELPDELAREDALDVRVQVFEADSGAWLHQEVFPDIRPRRGQIRVRLGFHKRIDPDKLHGRLVRYTVEVRKPGEQDWTLIKTVPRAELLFEKQKSLVEKVRLDRWVILGLCGQVLFMMRFLIQWIVSERRRESTIPVAFWWCSIVGASIVLVYGLVQREPIIILGQFGIIIYLRNLYLIYSNNKQKAEAAATPPDSAGS